MVRSWLAIIQDDPLKSILGAILAAFDMVFMKRRPQDLLNLATFSDQAFGSFWLIMGMAFRPWHRLQPDTFAFCRG